MFLHSSGRLLWGKILSALYFWKSSRQHPWNLSTNSCSGLGLADDGFVDFLYLPNTIFGFTSQVQFSGNVETLAQNVLGLF